MSKLLYFNIQTKNSQDAKNEYDKIYKEITSLWPARYRTRFENWYVRRQHKLKPSMAGEDFQSLFKRDFEDVLHHSLNWENSLRKALLQDAYLAKNRNLINKYRSQSKRQTVRKEQMTEQGDTGTTAVDLEMASVKSSTANITFVDERPVDTATLHTTRETYSRDMHYDIAENDWTMTKVLTREYPIKSIEWKVGTDDPQIQIGLPKLITDDADCMITRQLSFFAFLRAGVKVRVQLNGTKFHCGRLIAYFKPLSWEGDRADNLTALTCYPHFFLDASVSNSGELEIPFTHLLTYFSQLKGTCFNDSINSLGSFVVRPFNRLQASEGASQSLYGQIYVSLIKPYVHLPTRNITNFAYSEGYMQGLEALLKKGAGLAVNAGLGMADKFTGGLVTGAGDAICNLLGICDKPNDPISAAPIINRTVAPLAHGAGLDRSTRLGLAADAGTDTTPEMLGTMDGDYDILTLCKMPSKIKTFEWNTSQGQADRLYEFPITPVFIDQDNVKVKQNYTAYSPSMLAYVARAFCLWRGTLTVKIQVIATQFHSGRLALVQDPHSTTDVEASLNTYDQNKSHNVIVMDIQEQQELTIDLPYFAIKPWMRCDHFRSMNQVSPPPGFKNYLDCDVTGMFRIFIVNSLVAPSNVPDKIEVNVFLYAGSNFELTIPNPVSPLSFRTVTEATVNLPRYPYSKGGEYPLCEFNDAILTIYYTHKILLARKFIKQDNLWYESTMVVNTPDVLAYLGQQLIISELMNEIAEDSPCALLIKSLTDIAQEQGLENYTTTRENDGEVIPITEGNNKATVAPFTVSENAMNLQTLLRRFYPLYVSSNVNNSSDFTLITIPVTPSFSPDDKDTIILTVNQKRHEIHNLAWFSRLFTYWRGSMRYKICFSSPNTEVFVWHNPTEVKPFDVLSGFSYEQLTNQLNFASDIAMSNVQQGIEVEIPFYSSFNQLLHAHVEEKVDLRAVNGTLFIAIRNQEVKTDFSLFVSTGDDFYMNVLRAPPIVYESWVAAYNDADGSEQLKMPDVNRAMMHQSENCQTPGSAVSNYYQKGKYALPKLPGFQDEKLEEDQQMEEQMFSFTEGIESKIDEGIKKIDEFAEKTLPTVTSVNELTKEFQSFLKEFQSDILPAVLGHAKLFHQDVNNTHDTIKNFLPRLDETLSHFDAMLIQYTNVGRSFTDAAEGVEEASGYLAWMFKTLLISSVWLNLIEIYKKFSWTSLINIIVLLGALFRIEVSSIVQWLYSHCYSMYQDYRSKATNGAMREQGFEEFVSEYSEEVSLALAGIATVLYCALFGSLPKWETIKKAVRQTVEGTEQGLGEFLKSVHFANLGFKAINSTFDFFKTWMDKVVTWFLGQESRELLMEKQFKDKSKRIMDWLNEIDELEDDDMQYLALSDVKIHDRVYRLVDRSKEFTEWLMTEGVSKNVSSVVLDARKRVLKLVEKVNSLNTGVGFRYSPFVVMLEGKSGVAKSSMMHKFTDMARDVLGIPIYNSVCVVPKTEKFLDSYRRNKIIEWDDMKQCPAQDELVADFINWRSNAPCVINKAAVNEKGMEMVAEFMTLSTNHGKLSINTIRDMEAFNNRINLSFKCELRDGFTPDTLKTLPRDPDFGFVKMKAQIVEGGHFRTIKEDLTLPEAVALAKEHFEAWDEKQRELVDDYLGQYGSQKIPKGVSIQPIVEEAWPVAGVEQGQSVRYKVVIDEGLTEEEQIEAELFSISFEELDDAAQESTFELLKIKARRVIRKTRSYMTLLKKKFELACSSFYEKVKAFHTEHPNVTKVLGTLTMIGAAGFLIKSTLSMFNSDNSEDEPIVTVKKIVSTGEEAYETNVKKSTKLVKAEAYETNVKQKTKLVKAEAYETNVRKPTKLVKAEAVEHGTDDMLAIDTARNKIHPLLCILGWKDPKLPMLQGVCIGGKMILVPHHFFRRSKTGDFFYYVRGNDRIEIEYNEDRLFRIRDKDACLYYVGAQFDSRKNIVNCFIEERDLSRLSKTPVVLVGTTMKGVIIEKAGVATGNVEMNYAGKDEGAPVYTQYGWSYSMNTVGGECGSMLVAINKTLPPPAKIIGMHTAGYAHRTGGFSIVLTREMITETLNQAVAKFGPLVYGAPLPKEVLRDEQAFNERVRMVPEGSFSFYGVMDPKFCPAQPQKTSFRKTPFHGEIYEVTNKPAHLKAVKGESPLRKALKKYGVLTKPYHQKDIKIVRQSVINETLMLKADIPARVVTEEEAIFGIEGVPYCKRMNMKSSPGWPYQCLPNYKDQKGKAYLFDEETRKIVDPLLRKKLDEREAAAKRGERVESVWRDCMKDELRPNAKVDDLKTRLFTIAPTDFNILVRKYFLAFEQMFYKNHTKFFSAVGINPESFEWTESYNRLRKYGKKCVAGDFSGFDGTIMPDLMEEVTEIVNAWYEYNGETDPEAKLVRRVLMDEMIHTVQLVENCTYKTHQGNTSGNPITVMINTYVNIYYMRLTWLEIMKEENPDLATMWAYKDNVIEEIYSDDNRLVVKDAALQFFNQMTIATALEKHGIIYTTESKKKAEEPWKNLDDTSFLKRTYRFDDEIGKEVILPVLSMDTLTSLTNWVRDSDNLEEQLQANQKAALDFAFFHGREFYDEYQFNFSKAMRENEMEPVCITYDEQLDRFLSIIHGDTPARSFVDVGY
uniref:Genome polyprotein n=1 Tax=Picornavirales sp. TaxID=1955153 RepID=A0A6M9Z8N3_9VIRU|nr:MAG: hypothetical protein [Picornavirales sp.]